MDFINKYVLLIKSQYLFHLPLYVILLIIGFVGSYLLFPQDQLVDMSECKDIVDVQGSNAPVEVGKILVDIRGAIKNPGVYEVEEGTIIDNVIKLAGGLTVEADSRLIEQEINFSKSMTDREKLYLPYKNSAPLISPSKSSTGVSFTKKVNINSASSTELESLPGIGPATAKKIIDGRPYKVIKDLLEVKGIGEALLNKIKDKIEV